ncbi:hypothetical protein PISMIDRAFT_243364 [Pisolithus microcarpus 441]|uniref:Uncharacterized protein n=1 Tax=Pisolithus microcarpus 441 TaxID=765257 RepID=A0A0C9ZBN8_9AGAM|nr:hypothetical protein PISMIDRAFT_243364 [Pisolithus microcarpus 441]
MSVDHSPGPTWTTLREPTETSSVMRSSDDDGDDELEVENELTDMPLQKRRRVQGVMRMDPRTQHLL